jgi:8-oxo-dGTP pyrophosphatase MutT (NUDIX family)
MITSAGILLESNGKYLLGHPTGGTGTTHGWGIPKGKQDPGETFRETAIREYKEETGLDVTALCDLEKAPWMIFPVGKHKIVHVFRAYDHSGAASRFNFHCDSMIEGTKIPEIDKFYWATAEEALDMVTASQKCLFKEIIHDNNKKAV